MFWLQGLRQGLRLQGGAAAGSFPALSQLLISSAWLKGCGGDDSSSFLAKILLGGGLSVVSLPLGISRNLPNKGEWRR